MDPNDPNDPNNRPPGSGAYYRYYQPPQPRVQSSVQTSNQVSSHNYGSPPFQQYSPHPPHNYGPPPYYYYPPSYNSHPPSSTSGFYPPPHHNYQQTPPSAYVLNHTPTLSRSAGQSYQSPYQQATPGGPYRPAPSLASQQSPIHPKVDSKTIPNPDPPPQGLHPSHSSYGNLRQIISHPVDSRAGITSSSGGGNWQQTASAHNVPRDAVNHNIDIVQPQSPQNPPKSPQKTTQTTPASNGDKPRSPQRAHVQVRGRMAEFEAATAAQRQVSRDGIGQRDIGEEDEEDEEDETGGEDEDDDDGQEGQIEGSQQGGSDEESGEDYEYDSIMSQVSNYKGRFLKSMNGRRRVGLGIGSLVDSDMIPQVEKVDSNRLKKVRHRGPRAAAEVTGEIKMRLGLANEAFAESNIEEARRLVDEIIRINAETHEAWNLLSSIFQEQNLVEDALMALIVAAHLRPKHIEAWFNAGEYALTSMGELTPKILRDAQFCFASAVRQVPTSVLARRRKAQVLVMRENYNLAARDFVYILRIIPRDLEVIRELAMVYIDLGDGIAGVELYKKTIEHFKEAPDDYESFIDWNDLHSCAILYSLIGKDEEALKEMKILARWLLGREEETYWDDVNENDCEWDVDDSRRSAISQYAPGRFPVSSYGEGFPVELRIYLGKFRLGLKHFAEAMRHFGVLLDTGDGTKETMVQSHSHLVVNVADSLYESERYKDALIFYEALKEVAGEITADAYLQMGKCYLHEDRADEAENAFREACVVDEANIEARVELARMYERMDEAEQAFVYVNQILNLESIKQPKMYRRRRGNFAPEQISAKSFLPPVPNSSRHKGRKAAESQEASAAELSEVLRGRYFVLRKETDNMRAGNSRSMDAWLDSARALTEDFRTCRAFYPWDRKEFEGYTTEEALQAQTSLKLDLAALNQQQAQNIGSETTKDISGIPNHYRGIPFQDWLDLFCEYALCLAKRGRIREAYDVCEAAIHAICFMFKKEDMFLLHICYCLCALAGNDEETCVGMTRWFMVHYQFTTDSYRMFATLMRMCHSPISWYSSGPTQKFILRQIKAMDWALANEQRRSIIRSDKAGYTQTDQFGKIMVNEDLDVGLLMAYGHILVAGSSYVYALNYFHRAHAMDPENPMIILSLGLSYIQYGLKRQVSNRQYVIMQGLTLMHQYYDKRVTSPHFEERQEAHYNMARSYHLVGLSNLAIPYYKKLLNKVGAPGVENEEDWCVDAAFNLQGIYMAAGNLELAESVTRKWLVI